MTASLHFDAVPVSPVPDGDYLRVVTDILRGSRRQVLCSLFIVDLDPARDAALVVDSVLMELAAAVWRGVDVRLLIGGSRNNHLIEAATLMAHARALELEVPCRLAAASKEDDTHVKLVVADDWVLTGSHNWSAALYGDQTQDSVVARSAALAASLGHRFESAWAAAPQGGYDVSL